MATPRIGLTATTSTDMVTGFGNYVMTLNDASGFNTGWTVSITSNTSNSNYMIGIIAQADQDGSNNITVATFYSTGTLEDTNWTIQLIAGPTSSVNPWAATTVDITNMITVPNRGDIVSFTVEPNKAFTNYSTVYCSAQLDYKSWFIGTVLRYDQDANSLTVFCSNTSGTGLSYCPWTITLLDNASVDADLTAYSVTPLTLVVGGTFTFDTQSTQYMPIGGNVLIDDLTGPQNHYIGNIISYVGTSLTVQITSSFGTGTASNAWSIYLISSEMRVPISTNTTFYVRTTGNDMNDGLTVGTAWLTLAKALQYVATSIDIQSPTPATLLTITIDIGTGTFAGTNSYQSFSNLSGANIVISSAGGGVITDGIRLFGVSSKSAIISINNLTFQGPPIAPQYTLVTVPGGTIDSCTFILDGTAGVYCIGTPQATDSIITVSNCTVSGTGAGFILVQDEYLGRFFVSNVTYNTPTFTDAVFKVGKLGDLRDFGTNAGSATGTRYKCDGMLRFGYGAGNIQAGVGTVNGTIGAIGQVQGSDGLWHGNVAIQQETAATLLGNPTGAAALPSEITLGTNLSFAGSVLNATGGGSGATITGTPSTGALTTFSSGTTITNGDLTGDVITAGSTATHITAGGVVYAKIQNVAGLRLLGNPSSGSATVSELSLGTGLAFSAGGVVYSTVTGSSPLGYVGTGLNSAGGLINLTTPVTIASGGTGLTNVPSTGGLLIGDGIKWNLEVISGDGTLTSSGALTVTKTGGVAFGALATATTPITIAQGGTALSSIPSSGALLIGDGTKYNLKVLSGDVTLTSSGATTVNSVTAGGVTTAMVADNAITYAKMQHVSVPALLGTGSSGNAPISEITLGTGLAFSAGVLISTASTFTRGVTLQANPSFNTSNGTETLRMMGYGSLCQLTPATTSGTIQVTFDGSYSDTASATIAHKVPIRTYYGTGTAASTGAAVTGTLIGPEIANSTFLASGITPFAMTRVITGLSSGAAVWLDLAIRATTSGATVVLSAINCSAIESP